MPRTKKKRRITEGGALWRPEDSRTGGTRAPEPDIVLQMPELFYFDMRAYVASMNAAEAIDFYSRTRLYDMYKSALLDLHLSGIIDKRLVGVSRIPVEFRRDGKPDEDVNREIRAPWFRSFVKDVLWSKFWGFSLFQFYRGEDGGVGYYKVPCKHYDPVRKIILRYQSDTGGVPLDAFSNMLCVCEDPRSLGMLAELVPMVLYKRGDMADWAQFCQVFGMPIREYTYDAGDEEARRRLLQDARSQGANAVYIHPKESALNLIESANKSGTVDLYERFKDACNTEMSVRVLGNTLTTDSKATGTQALGTVHQEEEDHIKADDRQFVLDVLNYRMRPVFAELGIDTAGGEFAYAEARTLDPNRQVDVIAKAKAMGLPVADDYIYKTLLIDKPDDYDALKAEVRAKEEAERKLRERMAGGMDAPGEETPEEGGTPESGRSPRRRAAENRYTTSFIDRLRRFFGVAPGGDGALPF